MPATYPDLRDRTVIVTGGASGIGAAIVAAFAAQGARVGFLDFDLEAGAALADRLAGEGATVRFEPVDLRDIPALRAAIASVREAFGPVGTLVNNAARDDRHPTEDVEPDYFDERIATNFRHHFFTSQAVLPDMIGLGGGAIISLSSIGPMAGIGGMPVYSAAKSAVVGLVRSLARDYGQHNIRVNAIAPGWIMTERQKTLWLTPEADATRAERQCLARRLVPEDIARPAVFLASDDASAITGQTVVIDGGWV